MTFRIPFFIFFWSSFFCAKIGHTQDTIATNIIIDSLDNEVFYLRSKEKKPIAYFSPVFTPVCVDGTCYPIKINLFWDLAGNYLKYSLDPTEILTKIEHLPFTEFDYGLLHRVIANHKSALANFTIYELTGNKEVKVDGITGATRPELQGAFVPDALYTSYTLWHLVRAPRTKIIAYTENQIFDSPYFSNLLLDPSLGGQELALKYLLKKQQVKNVREVLQPIIDSTDNELTVKCIQLIPKKELDLPTTRVFFCEIYEKSDNPIVKKEILKRWQNELELSPYETETIARELGNYSAIFSLETELLTNTKKWSEPVYYTLLDKMNQATNMMRKEKVKRLLFSREVDFSKRFKREIIKNRRN